MTPERFQQIEELYHAARARTGDERAAWLAEVDPDLRGEIVALLAQPDSFRFLDQPAVENAGADAVTVVSAQSQLGPYRIERKLGQGGMGEVFRAIDTRLGRAVAVKTVHERFSDRFEREARAISALNHPHICTLYDVGPNYLVMELVEGETIGARLKSGPLPLKTALLYASQIASALVEAHGRDIIHRDLKPGNIMIGKSGVKVLDFGLAKSGKDETVTSSQLVMGTPGYMSPEQREGKRADARSDIYSFGCVLYEMVTGARVSVQRKRIGSRRIERIVGRCLEEDRAQRWQSAVELEREILAVSSGMAPWKIGAAAAAVLAVTGAAYLYFHHAPKLTDKDTIVLADFENKTGDPVFDGTLRQGLAIQLGQSPFLSMISDQRVQKALALMGQKADARLTPELGREICERTASAAVLDGSITNLGSQYVLGLRAKDCRTGVVLDEEQAQAARKEDVLNALSQIATKFRTRVGESLATVKQHDTPLAEATTPSLEALKAYSTGWKVLASTGSAAAVPHFKRATEIDPKFAMAYASLGRMYADIGEVVLSAENIGKAYQLRDHTSERERFFIAANYDVIVTGNLEKAQQTCELWKEAYPRDGRPHTHLAGLIYPVLGKYEKSVGEARIAIDVEPDFPVGYNVLTNTYISLDRLGEAENTLQRASDRKVQFPSFLIGRYEIAFLKGDQAGMERIAAVGREKSGSEDWFYGQEALVLVYSGHLREAKTMSQRAVDMARQAARSESMALYETEAAVWEGLLGSTQEAKRSALAVIELSRDRKVEYGAALALALSGDSSRSQTLTSDLEGRFPEDTSVRFSYVPTVRALLALSSGKPSDAIELLQIAVPYDLGIPRTWIGQFGALYSVYVRGEAYLAAKQGVAAAAEFQKILDHRGIVVSDPIGALAHLQLGRALALSGDKTRAKAAFQDFLALWKDADQDIPVLKQAKKDYATLN